MQRVMFVISVGGTKVQIAAVDACAPVVLADSGRLEWTREGRASLPGLLNVVANYVPALMAQVGVGDDAVAGIGVAWPGPVNNGRVDATFIDGCEARPDLSQLLRRALAPVLGPAVARLPVAVELDAYARACGECVAGSAFDGGGFGLLVNQATGIAGCLVFGGRAVHTHDTYGPAYGQFGRFLLREVERGRWHWSPTPDGSVPLQPPGQVRWTRWSAGPALARRAAAWCQAHACAPADPFVRSALAACARAEARDVAAERVVLEFVSEQWRDRPRGEVAAFAHLAADELGTAIDKLGEVLTEQALGCVVLAGGVGENFASPAPGQADTWLDAVRRATSRVQLRMARSQLGVRAELLGFCEQSSIPSRQATPQP